jgi:hypothetical protein
MKKHVALTMLVLTTLGVLNAHVDLPEVDGRRFVQAQGRLHDPLGWLEDRWNGWTRHCAGVQQVPVEALQHEQALKAIREFSPPDSRSAQMQQLLTAGPWLLAEVKFDMLSPAVVLLQQTPQAVRVRDGAIWSGSTEPWRAAPHIRRYLRLREPEMPAALGECFTPTAALFRPS